MGVIYAVISKKDNSVPKNKQPSRIKRTLNWLKPTSAKKGALLFAIAFVAIGGGYTAYKSYAAGAIVYPDSFRDTYRGTIVNLPGANKTTFRAMRLSPGGGTSAFFLSGNSVSVRKVICVPTTESYGTDWNFQVRVDSYSGQQLFYKRTVQWIRSDDDCYAVTIPAGNHAIIVQVRNSTATGQFLYIPFISMS